MEGVVFSSQDRNSERAYAMEAISILDGYVGTQSVTADSDIISWGQ